MAQNPFARQIAAEERQIGRAISASLTTALRARRVQQEADRATTGSASRPPRPVMQIFERALAREIRGVERQHRGLTIEPQISYRLQRSSWQATVAATARYPTETRGGASHTFTAGDTLWDLSERYYGHGAYWSAIADENPQETTTRRRFLACGEGVRIPRIEVVRHPDQIRALARETRPTREARRAARTPQTRNPTGTCGGGSARSITLNTPCFNGVRAEVTIALSGSISGQRQGFGPVTLDCRRYGVELQQQINQVSMAFRIENFTDTEITISNPILGGRYTASLSLSGDGTFGVSIAPRAITRRRGDYEIISNIGFSLRIRVRGCPPQGNAAPARAPARGRQSSGSRSPSPMSIGAIITAALAALIGRLLTFELAPATLVPLSPTCGGEPDNWA